MKKLLLCLLAITAAISTAWAQTPKKNIFGLRVGMDMSKISILDTGSGEKYLSELRTSFNIGLTDQVRLLNDKPFYFQFGLMLHNKGGKVQATDGGSDIELSLNAMYLELPVMLNYHIRLAPKVAVIPFAGFYGSLGVDGKQSFDDLGLEIQQNLFGKNKMFQRGDFGGRHRIKHPLRLYRRLLRRRFPQHRPGRRHLQIPQPQLVPLRRLRFLTRLSFYFITESPYRDLAPVFRNRHKTALKKTSGPFLIVSRKAAGPRLRHRTSPDQPAPSPGFHHSGTYSPARRYRCPPKKSSTDRFPQQR